MIDRTEALAQALHRRGFMTAADGDRVVVDAPAGSTATVVARSTPLTSFALLDDLDIRRSLAWARWTHALHSAVDAVWPTVSHLPERPPSPAPPPAPVVAPPLPHAYPLDVRIDPDFADVYDETRRGRFQIVTTWDSVGPSWEIAGPTVLWHAWGETAAWQFGASKGWASIVAERFGDGHPLTGRIEHVLTHAAKGEALPNGITALDLRGLPALAVYATVKTLLARVRSSDPPRKGLIILCSAHAAAYCNRSLDLDVT